jgi:hypothetical protein
VNQEPALDVATRREDAILLQIRITSGCNEFGEPFLNTPQYGSQLHACFLTARQIKPSRVEMLGCTMERSLDASGTFSL